MAQIQIRPDLMLTVVAAAAVISTWMLWSEPPAAGDADSSTAAPLFQTQSERTTVAQARPLDPAGVPRALEPTSPSADDMWNAVLNHSGLDPLWLKSHGFTPGSPALARLHSLLDGQLQLTSTSAKQIAFGPQGSTAPQATGTAPVLSMYERYVNAVLPTQELGGDSVLLRWRNASDNTVIHLSSQALPSQASGPMPLWMYSPTNWEPGHYRVEVLTPNAELGLLAAGEFSITASNSSLTPFSYEAQAPISPAIADVPPASLHQTQGTN